MNHVAREQLKAIVEAFWAKADRLDASLLQPAEAGRFPPLPVGQTLTTLELLGDALILLMCPRSWRRVQDCDTVRGMLLRVVREGQIVEPRSPHHGVFRRFLGSPSETIDYSWAAFAGGALLRLFQAEPPALHSWSAHDMQELRQAALLAARAAARHWPRPGHSCMRLTNLYAVLAAGRILEDPTLRQQGERCLAETLRFVRSTGAFEEFISPTYTAVNLAALVPLASLEAHGPLGADCLWLLQRQWELLARQAHLPTGQMAGPLSRAYTDKMNQLATSRFHQITGDSRTSTYCYLHLASKGRFPLDAASFTTLSLPGLFWPLRVPEAARAEMIDSCSPPRQSRQVVEWIGRAAACDAPAPGKAPRRVRLTTTCKANRWCLGTVNELDCWDQRRNLLAYWTDGAGGTTGVKAEVLVVPNASDVSFLPDWLFQMAVTFSAVQEGPAALGAWHLAAIRPASPGDRLQGLSRYVAPGMETQTEPREPIAWLLGTHWRQGIEPAGRYGRLGRLAFRFASVGAGRWQRSDAEGLSWTFEQADVAFGVQLVRPARLEGTSLVLADSRDVEWDWLRPPRVFEPWACWIRDGQPHPPTASGALQVWPDHEGGFALEWTAPAGRRLRLHHAPTRAPDRVEEPTWAGWVDDQPIR